MSKKKNKLNDSSVKYPSNSNKKKKSKKKKVEKGKVITQNAKRRKKTTMQKFFSSFIGEDVDNVGHYIVHDILIPTAKTTIIDMVNGGLEMLFHGESSGRTRRGSSFGRRGSYVSYNSASSKKKKSRRSKVSKLAHNFDDIVFTDKEEAQMVLDYLVDMTIDMGEATVGDFYRAVGIKASHTDENFGWTRLNTARIRRNSGRKGIVYTIAFPRTEEL